MAETPLGQRLTEAVAMLFQPKSDDREPVTLEQAGPRGRLSVMLDSNISPGRAVDELSELRLSGYSGTLTPSASSNGLHPRALFSHDDGRAASLDDVLGEVEPPVSVAEKAVRDALFSTTVASSPPKLERLRSALEVADSQGVTTPAVTAAKVHLSQGDELAVRTQALRSALERGTADASQLASLVESVLRASTMSLSSSDRGVLAKAEERLQALSASREKLESQLDAALSPPSGPSLRASFDAEMENGLKLDMDAVDSGEYDQESMDGDLPQGGGEDGERAQAVFGSLNGYEAFEDEHSAGEEEVEEAAGPPKSLLLACGLCRCVLCPLIAAAAVFAFTSLLPSRGVLPPEWWDPCPPTVARAADGRCLPYNWQRIFNATVDGGEFAPRGETFMPLVAGEPTLCQALCVDVPTCHGFVVDEHAQTCHFRGDSSTLYYGTPYDLWRAHTERPMHTLWILWGSHAQPPSPPPEPPAPPPRGRWLRFR